MRKIFKAPALIALFLLGLSGVYLLSLAFAGKIEVHSGFSAGKFVVRWYSWILVLAIIAGYLISSRYAAYFKIEKEILADLVFWNIIAGFIGARAYHIVTYWGYYSAAPYKIFYFWQGGLAAYGMLMGGIFLTWFFSRSKKISFWAAADCLSLGLIAGHAIGRWGNFFNQEAFGSPTDLFWKMYITPANRPIGFAEYNFFHPVFLYEFLVDAIILAVLILTLKKITANYSGVVFSLYLILYSAARFLLENLRVDSVMIWGMRSTQVVAICFLAYGLVVLIFRSQNRSKKEGPL